MRVAFLLCFAFSIGTAIATVITVDNNIPSIGQYTSIQAAHDAAVNGDIIQVFPSNIAYGGFNVTKDIDIIGCGFYASGVLGTSLISTNDYVHFSSGSSGSKIEGFAGFFLVKFNDYCTNIIIDNCQLRWISAYEGDNYIIRNCCITGTGSWDSEHMGSVSCLVVTRPQSSSMNYIINNVLMHTGTSSQKAVFYFLNSNYHLYNNIVLTGDGCCFAWSPESNPYIYNNILNCKYSVNSTPQYYYPVSPNIAFNICNHSYINNNYSNLPSIDLASIYDADYHLLPNSPAIDAGNPDPMFNDLDGTRNDCGAYGGPTPFVDGGIPGLPSIYQISGDYIVGQDQIWELEIKAKTNRE